MILPFVTLQVYINGIVSLDSSLSTISFNSIALPLNGTDKIIAPYWADIDTRGTGEVYYRQTTDLDLLNRATCEIKAAFPLSKRITNLLIVTWDAVGYYNQQTDKVSQKQSILAMIKCTSSG